METCGLIGSLCCWSLFLPWLGGPCRLSDQYLTTVPLPCRQCKYSPTLSAETLSSFILGVLLPFLPLRQGGRGNIKIYLSFALTLWACVLCIKLPPHLPYPEDHPGLIPPLNQELVFNKFTQHSADSTGGRERRRPRTPSISSVPRIIALIGNVSNLGLVT